MMTESQGSPNVETNQSFYGFRLSGAGRASTTEPPALKARARWSASDGIDCSKFSRASSDNTIGNHMSHGR